MQRGVATSHQVGTLEGDEGLEVFERRAYFGLSNCTFGFIFLKLQKSVDKLQKRWFFRQMSGICTKSEAHSNATQCQRGLHPKDEVGGRFRADKVPAACCI
jgi:hypothetical protein